MTKYLLLLSIISINLLPSCKKGSHDPFISLRSRDVRIIGEWTLASSENIGINDNNGNIYETNTKYEGTNTVSTTSYNGQAGATSTSSNAYKARLWVNKDGTVKFELKTINSSGYSNTTSETGMWTWMDGKKNKSHIMVTNMTNSWFSAGTYKIDELRNKTMVLKRTWGNENNTNNFFTGKLSLTFKQ